MRNEIAQYMSEQRYKRGNGKQNSMAHGSPDKMLDQSDAMSQSQTKFLQVQKMTPGVVRTIFDSTYLRPEENPRCINYSDPAKAYIIQDAERRYAQKKAETESRNRSIEARMNRDLQKTDDMLR